MNAYFPTKNSKNTLDVKERIVDGHARGVCTRDGGHIPKEKRGAAGKGDRMRHINKKRYDENYVRIFGHE